MKVAELKELLKAHGLKTSGRKKELMLRLEESGILDGVEAPKKDCESCEGCSKGCSDCDAEKKMDEIMTDGPIKRVRSPKQQASFALRSALIKKRLATGVGHKDARKSTLKDLSPEDLRSLADEAGLSEELMKAYFS